tara:strand:+ start:656 stop:838 length:183 start_codon:yes stop_codon:yes gene_type:complete
MAGCNRITEMSEFYDERDYWWNLMEKSIPTHPSPNIPSVLFKDKKKEDSEWDYDTFGHGG